MSQDKAYIGEQIEIVSRRRTGEDLEGMQLPFIKRLMAHKKMRALRE